MPKQTPRKLVLWPIVLSVYLGGFLTYSVVPLGRLATTYSALDIGTSKQVIALLSAVFALLPACMTMLVGRLNSQGRYGLVATCGALAILSACLILYALPVSLGVFLCGTGLLGIGQTCCLTALQIVLFRSSTRQHRDGLLGNFMVVMSLGQVTAPLMIGLPVERQTLFAIAACGAVVLVAASLFMGRLVTVDKRTEGTSKVSLRDITHTPGLPWIIVIGSICVAAQDIVLTFLPVLGIERGIPEATIGLLLSVRAMAAMFSRAIFGQAVRRFGRMPLLLFSSGMAGLAFLALMLPLPVMLLGLALAINGHVIWTHVETATLHMRTLSAAFIHDYLEAAGDAVLKSVGAYQIEGLGMHLFDKIEGDHTTIMGMPLLPLLRQFRNMGLIVE